MIFLRINYPNFIGLVWRRHTKFETGMAESNIYPVVRDTLEVIIT